MTPRPGWRVIAFDVDTVFKRLAQGAQVLARTALDDPPLRPVLDRQQAVIFEEAYKERHGEIHDGAAVRRPDRRSHGDKVLALEGVAVAPAVQVAAQSLLLRQLPRLQISNSFLIEAQNVPHHGDK